MSLLESSVEEAKKISPFPIKTNVYQTEIGDNTKVDLLLVSYQDRLQVTLTSIGKPGVFLEVISSANDRDPTSGSSVKVNYSVRTVFGKSNETYELIARAIAEELDTKLPILVSLGFKDNLAKEDILPLVRFVKEKVNKN